MLPRQTTCNTDRIEMYLRHQLVADEEDAFQQHLETCRDCRERLEAAAAEPHWWHRAGEYLQPDDVDAEIGNRNATGADDAAVDTGPDYADDRDAADVPLDFLDPSDDPRMLGRLGGYEITGLIGQGGMGIVLKGFDVPLNRYVAVKVLDPHLASRGAAQRRFSREARAAAAVMHENVVAIHRVSDSGRLPFLVMPYVRGPSLQKRLDQRGPLELAEILRVGMHVASGLAEAHEQGIVHRDIKPANIHGSDGVAPGVKNDQGFVDLLTDRGYTVVRKDASDGGANSFHGPLSSGQKALLNDADLIIVSRNARSDDYNYPDDWNGITAPLMLTTPYLARSHRWKWFDTGNWDLPTGTPPLWATPGHPLFDNVPLDDDGRVNILTADSSQIDVTGAGNGTVIARRADAHWLGEDGALYRSDWSEKPALEAYRDLVFRQWWTEEEGRTDPAGEFSVRGFLGEYEVAVEYDGVRRVVPVRLDPDGNVLTLAVPEPGGRMLFIAGALGSGAFLRLGRRCRPDG